MKTGWSCPRGQSKNGEGRNAPGPEKTDTQGPGLEEAVLARWQGTQQPADAQRTERLGAPGDGSLGTGRHSLVARRPPRRRHGQRMWLSGSWKRNGRAWQMPPADHRGKVTFTSVIPGPTHARSDRHRVGVTPKNRLNRKNVSRSGHQKIFLREKPRNRPKHTLACVCFFTR